MISETGPEYCSECEKIYPVRISSWFWATGDRFLDEFEENVISGQRSIRIFGKRFMESEMASILVQGSDQNTKICVFQKS